MRPILTEEAAVPGYELPRILQLASGEPVTTATQWWSQRRPEILDLFEEHVYGRVPGLPVAEPDHPVSTQTEILESSERSNGKAVRLQLETTIRGHDQELVFTTLIYRPLTDEPCPFFLGLNFFGNHSITPDPEVPISAAWMRESQWSS